MTTSSRTAQSAHNAGISIVAQIILIILGFVTRTVFITQLGVAMLGVNSLLTSLLALLAFADLGINGAFMYALYKPLSDQDTKKVSVVVKYAGRLYRRIACVVAIIGIAMTPFIHEFIHLKEEVQLLNIYYLVFLANTVVGYLMQNRLILLNADQKIYVIKYYSMVFNALRSVVQILALLMYESFLIFLAIQVVFTLANNLSVYIKAGRQYPFLHGTSDLIDKSDKDSILRSTYALMLYRIGGLILTNSVPLFISIIIGTVALGYYSNYILIVSSAVMITEVVFSALTPSVGNLFTKSSNVITRRVFDEIVTLSILIHGFVSVAFIVLMDDFIELWLGSEFVLPQAVVIAIVFNFYVTGTMMPLWSFRSATGLFRKTQFIIVATAAISIGLSLSLGFELGMVAVVSAPAIARLVTGAWFEPWLLIRDHMSGRVWPYFGLHIGAFFFWASSALLITIASIRLSDYPLVLISVKVFLLICVMPLVSWLIFRRSEGFKLLLRRLAQLARQIRSRLQKEGQ